MDLSSEISSSFKLHGYQLRQTARSHFEALLSDLPSSDWRPWIDKILDHLREQDLESPIISKELLVSAIETVTKSAIVQNDEEESLSVLSAFEMPRYFYSEDAKKFILNEDKGRIYPDAKSKAQMFRSRYYSILQRTSRHELFTPALLGSSEESLKKKFALKKVEYLLGTNNKLTDVIVLGMLIVGKRGNYCLEDPSGIVELDLTDCNFQSGLFTEGCFVLLEGWYDESLFHVIALGFPPIEPSSISRSLFGKGYFKRIGVESSNAMFVILSDVHLDQVEIFQKLTVLFRGYSSSPPTAFILMGNFLSHSYGKSHASVLRDHFKMLADLVAPYKDLISTSKFYFIPGSSDPGHAHVFPRPSLPKYVTEPFSSLIPIESLSNPCRIYYCQQEIVIFREDIISKMCRNVIKFPSDGSISVHFAKTIVSQGHLSPLTIPIYWDFDHSLHLYPLPDLVIIGDKFDPFSTEVGDCKVINIGSFGKHDFSFKTYVPKTKTIEDCQVSNNDNDDDDN